MHNKDIDIVITWVDGNDPLWLEDFNNYTSKSNGDKSKNRFRDYGFLKYWFRSIELNAPWVRTIHFVTWGHLPEWLNTSNPKLNIVKHSDFIPVEFLPTFNSCVIELNMHRIKDLSDNFIYFNDDMFLLNKRNPEDFFINNKPVDLPIFENLKYYAEFDLTYFRNAELINRNFNRRNVLKNNFLNWINFSYPKNIMIRNLWSLLSYGLLNIEAPHLALNLSKIDFIDLWDKENKYLNTACSKQFRDCNDINPFVVRMWNIHSNRFELKKLKFKNKWINLHDSLDYNKNQIDQIFNQTHDLICLNDDIKTDEIYEETRKYLLIKFDSKLPFKSSFEL